MIAMLCHSIACLSDDLVVDRPRGMRFAKMVALSELTATRIEIPESFLREAFDKMSDGVEKRLPIPGTEDNVVISRSGNHLNVIAIVDNIGCDIKIKQRFQNFRNIRGAGKILIDRNISRITSVTVIAGNVGSVITLTINADTRTVSRQDNEEEENVTKAVSGFRYRCYQGQTIRFPRGYRWWDGTQWVWGSYEDATVTFEAPTYVYSE